MKKRIFSCLCCVAAVTLVGCGDDEDNGDNGNDGAGGNDQEEITALGVVMERTGGEGTFHVKALSGEEDHYYCYEDTGCEDQANGFPFATTEDDLEMTLLHTDLDRVATGIQVTVEVEEGTGTVSLVDGYVYTDSQDWEWFGVGDVLEPAGELAEGDRHTFVWGDVEIAD